MLSPVKNESDRQRCNTVLEGGVKKKKGITEVEVLRI